MPTFPFMQVDAFTETRLGGNPCAVVFDADGLDDATMLAIAREMNLSETAFVVRSAIADVGARYFTPAEEIPLAGHPTIAPIFGLVPEDALPGAPIQTVSTGTPQLMIPLRDHAALRRVSMDTAAYSRLR